MKNEFEGPKGPAPLDEEAAHEEANMLRAQMYVSPETGKIAQSLDSREDREATAEDYDKALEAVEELKRIVQEQPESMDLLAKVMKPLDTIVRIPGLGVAYLMRASAALHGLNKPGGSKAAWERASVMTDIGQWLEDSEQELRDLKARGEKLGQNETKEAA
jgi:hypothetical protein